MPGDSVTDPPIESMSRWGVHPLPGWPGSRPHKPSGPSRDARRGGPEVPPRKQARRRLPHPVPAAAPPEVIDMHTWEPHISRHVRLRIHDTSCCGEYKLASEGGEFFVLRQAGNGTEETARGRYGRAVTAWLDLSAEHKHKATCDR